VTLAVPARKRILFVSEAITLAQMVRLVTLARALPRDHYEVHFASSQFPGFVFDGLDVRRWPLWGLWPDKAMARVASGKLLYSRRVLHRCIEADRQVILAIEPDLVVGDLRWSLAVSAPICGVPFASLINAYWSPFANRPGFPMPEHPIVRILGEKLAAKYFPRALPWVFAHFAAPLNAERRLAGLPEIGSLLAFLARRRSGGAASDGRPTAAVGRTCFHRRCRVAGQRVQETRRRGELPGLCGPPTGPGIPRWLVLSGSSPGYGALNEFGRQPMHPPRHRTDSC
jgi:hypothetical protein